MKKITALFSALALVAGVAAIAGPPASKDKKPVAKAGAKTVEVWTCPIAGKPVADHSAKGVAYKGKTATYNVHFCCAGCPEEFAKLSPKDKEAKIAAALKKETPAKKG